ncbi:MAG: hypothetical protein ACD_16C00166G0003 [uncultured bacterium]|nr:MAG: hypothetical protein ACD_16C00166G0003 [uncultured bacterium]
MKLIILNPKEKSLLRKLDKNIFPQNPAHLTLYIKRKVRDGH